MPAGLEPGTALEGEDDAGERLVEFRGVDAAPAARRIVQPRAPVAKSLEDHEVVEVPEDDRGKRQLGEVVGLLLEAARHHAVARAARSRPPALLPSRLTPQSTRICSSGTWRP